MAVTHAPAGFTGTVDQIDEARRFALGGGGRFRVSTSTDWVPSASGSVNRTVNVAAGMASACGVIDITTAVDTLAFAANAGGSDRFDALVATFDWSALTISFRIIQGTTVPPAIVKTGSTVDPTKINWLPGLRYDAVIAIIRARPSVTLLAPADLYDCRPWGSWGMLNVTTATFRDQIDTDISGRIRDLTGVISEWTGSTWISPEAYTATSIDGVAIPSGARIVHLRKSIVTTVTSASGGFNAAFGMTFTKLMSVIISPGDNSAGLAFIVPIASNHTTTSANGAAFQSTGAVVINGSNIRVELDVLGYI